MTTLRTRLVLMVVVISLAVAAVIVIAVQRFSADQVMRMLMEGAESPAEAQAMFDEYVGRVLVVAALVGVALGSFAAWWLVRRVMRPLEQLTAATRAIAGGDLRARVPEPPDPELHSLAASFNEMAATLERIEELRRSLVEDVAHELRTPLTTLRGYTEALSDGVIEPTPEMLRTVHEEIERLTRLVEGLDQLARGQGDGEPIVQPRAEVDLAAIVRRTLELAAPELAARRITFEVSDPGDLPRPRADGDAIGQVVTNLVQNAARYTDDGGMVAVTLRADGAWVRCGVENTGPPIPPDELPLIWERLYRIDRSRARASGGAGIGLAIVRQIVEAHGGQVGARSAGDRTEIWFCLPVTAA